MKKFTSCIRSKANGLALRARMALSNQRGDFYISDAVKIIIAVVLGALLLADLVLTIRQLALVSRLMKSVTSAGEALQLQLALGRAELADKLDEQADELRRLRREQLARLEKYTRRFRKHYAKMTVSASRYRPTMEDLRAAGALALEELQKKKEQLQAARRRNK